MDRDEKTKLMKKCVHKAYDRGYKTGYNMAENKMNHEQKSMWDSKKVCEWLEGYSFIPTYVINELKQAMEQ